MCADKPYRLLIFEPESAGHRHFFLRNFILYMRENQSWGCLSLVIPPDLARMLEKDRDLDGLINGKQVEILRLEEGAVNRCTTGQLLFRALHCWATFMR